MTDRNRAIKGSACARLSELRPPGVGLWLIDFIALMGGQHEMIKELREKIFAGKPFKSLQSTTDGNVGVKEW